MPPLVRAGERIRVCYIVLKGHVMVTAPAPAPAPAPALAPMQGQGPPAGRGGKGSGALLKELAAEEGENDKPVSIDGNDDEWAGAAEEKETPLKGDGEAPVEAQAERRSRSEQQEAQA